MDIFISTWNFEKYFKRGQLTLDDLPELATSNRFSGIEVMDRQIDLSNSDYVARFAKRLKRVKCSLILDLSTDLTYQEEILWLAQIDYVRQSLKTAKKLGAQKVRILLGGQAWSFQKLYQRKMKDKRENQVQTNQNLLQSIATSPLMARASHLLRKKTSAVIRNEDSKMQRALLALQEIMPEAERLEIPVVIENHWGISSRPENILSIVEQVNSDYIGTCPDFDNFPKETDRYDGLKILASRALHVHAKSSRFMPNGEEKNIDFKRCMQILRDADYQNGITIEYEGRRDVLQGCLITGNLILKHWKRRSRKRSKQ